MATADGLDDERRLREILDKDAIREVLVRYVRGIDRGDVDLVHSVFHPDAIEVHGPFRGPSHDWIDQLDLGAPRTDRQHALAQSLIELDGDTARSETYVIVARAQRPDDGEPCFALLHGRYVDRLERRGGEWKISHRTAVLDVTWETSNAAEWKQTASFVRGGRFPDDPIYQRSQAPAAG